MNICFLLPSISLDIHVIISNSKISFSGSFERFGFSNMTVSCSEFGNVSIESSIGFLNSNSAGFHVFFKKSNRLFFVTVESDEVIMKVVVNVMKHIEDLSNGTLV